MNRKRRFSFRLMTVPAAALLLAGGIAVSQPPGGDSAPEHSGEHRALIEEAVRALQEEGRADLAARLAELAPPPPPAGATPLQRKLRADEQRNRYDLDGINARIRKEGETPELLEQRDEIRQRIRDLHRIQDNVGSAPDAPRRPDSPGDARDMFRRMNELQAGLAASRMELEGLESELAEVNARIAEAGPTGELAETRRELRRGIENLTHDREAWIAEARRGLPDAAERVRQSLERLELAAERGGPLASRFADRMAGPMQDLHQFMLNPPPSDEKFLTRLEERVAAVVEIMPARALMRGEGANAWQGDERHMARVQREVQALRARLEQLERELEGVEAPRSPQAPEGGSLLPPLPPQSSR